MASVVGKLFGILESSLVKKTRIMWLLDIERNSNMFNRIDTISKYFGEFCSSWNDL